MMSLYRLDEKVNEKKIQEQKLISIQQRHD